MLLNPGQIMTLNLTLEPATALSSEHRTEAEALSRSRTIRDNPSFTALEPSQILKQTQPHNPQALNLLPLEPFIRKALRNL